MQEKSSGRGDFSLVIGNWLLGEGFVELGDGDDAFLPDFEVHGFVGGMDGILLQAEAHEDRFTTEDLFKGCYDWDRTAAARRKRTFAKGNFEAFLGCFVCRNINRADIALTAVHRGDFDADTLRFEGLYIIYERA